MIHIYNKYIYIYIYIYIYTYIHKYIYIPIYSGNNVTSCTRLSLKAKTKMKRKH